MNAAAFSAPTFHEFLFQASHAVSTTFDLASQALEWSYLSLSPFAAWTRERTIAAASAAAAYLLESLRQRTRALSEGLPDSRRIRTR